VHVLALTIVVGSIVILDLRLMDLAWRERRVRAVSKEILPFTWGAFLVAVVTGSLLFSSKAVRYLEDLPFQIKILLICLAGLNMIVFHLTTYRRAAAWDNGGPTPRAARVSAALSLGLWALVIVFGRWIGFTIL